MTSVAESSRPYSCKICKKKFSQLSNLQFHQRVHSRSKPFTCKDCHASFRQQHLLQQHINSSHQGINSASNFCKLCQSSFDTITTFHSHLVKSHSAYFASKSGRCVSKDKIKLHKKAPNGVHHQSLKKGSGRRQNGALPDNCGYGGFQNRGIGDQVSNKNQMSPDRTMLHLEIEPPPAITRTTAPVKHQIICSPDSTTDAFGMAKVDHTIAASVGEDSKDSMEEPKWYIGAPDGKMEEMSVYKDLSGREKMINDTEDTASRGTKDTDDVDVISSAPDSPECQLSPRELHIEPSSTTSPDTPCVGNSPHRSLAESSIISIGSTPVASPACPTVGSSPDILADDTSQPTTVEACESEPASPAPRDPSPNAELLYGQCGDSDDDIVKRRVNEQVKRHSISSSSDIDVETNTEFREKPTVSNSQSMLKKESLVSLHMADQSGNCPSPEKARGQTVSPGKDTVDTPVKVAEDVFSADDQDVIETGGDDESLSSSTGCMPRLELQSPGCDSPRARHMRRQNSKEDMPIIDKEMPCIEKEFPVLERQTSISPDYRRCDMKEELTSSTDQESPNSTGTDVEPTPPDILPQYGPSMAPANKSPRNKSSEIQAVPNQGKSEVDTAYFGDDDDQYTGSTEEDETDEYWSEKRSTRKKSGSSPTPKKGTVENSGKNDRQLGFFDVFENFLQTKGQELVNELESEHDQTTEGVEKEKRRVGRPPRRKSETPPKPEYTSSEGEDLGEFRVEAADPTVLKISRISPGSRVPPVSTPETKLETTIPEHQTHMVASTNGTVVTLRRISSTKPSADPVHVPSDSESTNPGADGNRESCAAGVKTEAEDLYQFTDDTKDNDAQESQDKNSGNYTLRKRKKVNFNLLAEGTLSDDDFIPDVPLVKKNKDGMIESPHKKNGKGRKKKPFDKAHFLNYNRRLLRLRKGVCVLLETLFPEMVYPRRFNPETHSVDYLVDYISTEAQEAKSAPTLSRCYGEIDWNATVLLCNTPKDCLRHLRRQLMKMLKALLPGLKVNRYFDHSGASVDALIEEITFVNDQHVSSQASYQTVPLLSEISGATPTCVSTSNPGQVGAKTKSHDVSTVGHVESVEGPSIKQLSSTKRKRGENVNSDTLMPPPMAPPGDTGDPAIKKQRKNPISGTTATDEPQPSTSSTVL